MLGSVVYGFGFVDTIFESSDHGMVILCLLGHGLALV